MDTETAILAENLSRIYPMGSDEVVGVRDIGLLIRRGDMVVIKGESGSGKTTLISLLAGLDRPTGGRLTVAGLSLDHASPKELTAFRRKSIGIVFQNFNLLPTLSVMENIRLPALLAGGDHAKVNEKAMELLRWLRMEARAHHFPSQLSGGEMQRCAIARALINNPALILADEPTGNLDSQNGTAVIELLAEFNRDHRRRSLSPPTALLPTRSQQLLSSEGRLYRGAVGKMSAFFRLWIWFSFRQFRLHAWRTVAVLLGIGLGAAVFTSVRLATDASVQSFANGMDTISGKADRTVTRPGGRLPEELTSVLLRSPEVRAASPFCPPMSGLEGTMSRCC